MSEFLKFEFCFYEWHHKIGAMCYFGPLSFCNIYTYRYAIEISFANICGSNGPILLKFTQLIQWVV